ncbi:MAG: imidazole glycerol phosphate synthase subunit HisH [Solirubrobacteraceae bacterium]
MNIVIIDYGAGNVTSVQNTFERLNINTTLSKNANEILAADKVIFPGQGEARYAMEQLEKYNLIDLIKNLTQPVLGICIGMQLLGSYSEERETVGLGIIPTEVKKFNISKSVPHMGWNNIETKDSLLKEFNDSYFYFAHSYYMPVNEYTIAKSSHEIEFSSVVRKDNFFGCQFHPEKSSAEGDKFIQTFINLNS